MVEYGLDSLPIKRTHSMHPSHVMNSIHVGEPLALVLTLATPIIESRVTRAASSASVRVSVLAGRSGSTK
jgi:hypothetical protein